MKKIIIILFLIAGIQVGATVNIIECDKTQRDQPSWYPIISTVNGGPCSGRSLNPLAIKIKDKQDYIFRKATYVNLSIPVILIAGISYLLFLGKKKKNKDNLKD